jgi:hypothetical protein
MKRGILTDWIVNNAESIPHFGTNSRSNGWNSADQDVHRSLSVPAEAPPTVVWRLPNLRNVVDSCVLAMDSSTSLAETPRKPELAMNNRLRAAFLGDLASDLVASNLTASDLT